MSEDKSIEILLHKLSLKETSEFEENQYLYGQLLKLESKNLIRFTIKENFKYELTEEGKLILENGSPEYNLIESIDSDGIEIEKSLAFNYAMKNRWLCIENNRAFKNTSVKIIDSVRESLNDLNVLDEKTLKLLQKRRLIENRVYKSYEVQKTSSFTKNIVEQATELTVDMLENGKYKELDFKEYNFKTEGSVIQNGSFHPLMKIRDEYLSIFTNMGFNEMKTDRFVESSFWNFDALFQPQNHPAREMQDTFFLSSKTLSVPTDFMQRTKNVHEGGHYESKGYQNEWCENIAKTNILRTHTTAISARYLYDLAKNFKPIKLFSIDRVFRNESVDATHLAEFHQIEGLIVDKNLTIGHLKGVLSEFFKKLGINKIKFKPTFNPYTEPSMEIFAYHEQMKKWMEVGNSGIFRPEMLLPMKFDKDVRVIAWGLSLERPAMIKYSIDNIRDLIGPKVSYEFIKNS